MKYETLFDQSLITKVTSLNVREINKAIESAHRAFKTWLATTAKERATTLRKWYDLQLEHLDELAYLLTLEQGKPLAEATTEIRFGASFVEWFAEEASRVYGDTIPAPQKDQRIITLRASLKTRNNNKCLVVK